MADFFISRNSADQDWGEWIAWQLEKVAGYSVVLQDWDFRPGDNFLVRMNEEAARADRMIVVLSPSYLLGRYSEAEWTAFIHEDPTGRRGRLLVAQVRPTDVPFLLRPIVRIELDTAADEQTAARRLLDGVRRGRRVPEHAPTFPGGPPVPVVGSREGPTYPPQLQHERVAAAAETERHRYRAGRDTAHAAVRTRVVGLPVSLAQGHFYDRTDDQHRLSRLLATPGTKLISVIGRRGIGKSALVDHVLAQLEENRWPHADDASPVDGIVYISTRTRNREISLERIFLDCASLLGEESQEALERVWAQRGRTDAEKVEVLISTLADRLVVILLDNLEDVLDGEGRLHDEGLLAFFDVVFRARRGPRVVVTSQVPLALDPEVLRLNRRLQLEDGLPDDEAVAMLREMDEATPVGLSELPDSDLLTAVRRVDGNPLGLHLVFGALERDPTSDLRGLLSRFDSDRDVLAQLVGDSYRELDDDARTVVQALAVLSRPVPAAAVDFVVEPLLPGVRLPAITARLVRGHHVTHTATTGTVSLHPLNADFTLATLSAEDPARRTALERRAAEWYREFRQPSSSWRTTDDLNPQLLEFDHLVNAGMANDAARLIADIAHFLVWHGSSRRLLALLERIDGQVTDPEQQARHALAMGLAKHVTGPLDEASRLSTRAVGLARDLGLRQLTAQALAMSGEAARLLGRLDEAADTLQEASEVAHDVGDDETEERALRCLGLALVYKGGDDDLRRAEATVRRLYALHPGPGAVLRRAQALDLASLVSFRTGRYEQAVEEADAAMAGFGEAGHPWAVGYVRNVRGMALLALDRADEASADFRKALLDGEAVEGSRIEGLASYNLAWSEHRRGHRDEAVDAARRAADALSGQGPAERAAATALHEALSALRSGELGPAARALLDAARASASTADFYPARDLAQVAQGLALAVGESRLAAAAAALRCPPGT